MHSPFRYFNSSPEVIRLTVMIYIRYPLSLRQVEDLLFERGIDICYETVRAWWNRFGPIFALEIRKRRVASMHGVPNWRWHLDEVLVRINGENHYLWRAIDHEGEVLEAFVTKRRDRKAALRFLRKAMKRYGRPDVIVMDRLRSCRAAMTSAASTGRTHGRSYQQCESVQRLTTRGRPHIHTWFCNGSLISVWKHRCMGRTPCGE